MIFAPVITAQSQHMAEKGPRVKTALCPPPSAWRKMVISALFTVNQLPWGWSNLNWCGKYLKSALHQKWPPKKSHDIAFWSPRPPASWRPSCRGTRWTQLYHCRLRRTCWSSPGEIYDGDVAVKKPEVHPQLDFLQASSWLLQARQCWCSRFRQCRTQGTPFIDKWKPWQSKYCLPISWQISFIVFNLCLLFLLIFFYFLAF